MHRDNEHMLRQDRSSSEAPTNVVPFPVPPPAAGRSDEATARLDGMLDSDGYFTQSDEEFLTDLGLLDTGFMPPPA